MRAKDIFFKQMWQFINKNIHERHTLMQNNQTYKHIETLADFITNSCTYI